MFDKLKQSIKKAFNFLGKHESEDSGETDLKTLEEEKKNKRNKNINKANKKKEEKNKKDKEKKEDTKKKENKKKEKKKKTKVNHGKKSKKESSSENKEIKSKKSIEEKDEVKDEEKERITEIDNESKTSIETKEDKLENQKSKKPKFSEKEFDALFEEFELMLLEANVSLEAIEKLKEELKNALLNKKGKLKKIFEDTFIEVIESIIRLPKIDVLELANKHKPLKILFMGVNGSGKTTSMAKLANFFLKNNKTVVFAAADTFRAASIEQLQHHAKALGIKVIAHQYGSDPAAVAYDAVQYAKSHGIDVVLIDSAGRLHTNVNLMKELEKIKRIIQPELTFLVVDALTGHDAVDQAIEFGRVGFDGIIVTKYDADDKGGTVISLCEVTKKPIVFIGTGQGYDDIEYFDADKYLDELFGGEEE